MVVILAVLFGLVTLQAIISLANGYANPIYQPRKILLCRPFSGLITIIVVIFILIMFFLAGILLGVTTFTADFCFDPIYYIIDISGLATTSPIYYYVSFLCLTIANNDQQLLHCIALILGFTIIE